jgi:hypothetical protein
MLKTALLTIRTVMRVKLSWKTGKW